MCPGPIWMKTKEEQIEKGVREGEGTGEEEGVETGWYKNK